MSENYNVIMFIPRIAVLLSSVAIMGCGDSAIGWKLITGRIYNDAMHVCEVWSLCMIPVNFHTWRNFTIMWFTCEISSSYFIEIMEVEENFALYTKDVNSLQLTCQLQLDSIVNI